MDTKVIDSRLAEDGRVIRRRRECERCEHRFTTLEKLRTTDFLVIKKNGTTEYYNREKVMRGILSSVQKRPVDYAKVEEELALLEERWASAGEVSSTAIGDGVMAMLRDLDEVAYIRFASIYQDFKTKEEFMQVVGDIAAPGDAGGAAGKKKTLF